MSNATNTTTTNPLFLSLLYPCRHGNGSASRTAAPPPESSTGEEVGAEDTDFGAVMYITAVLVFYSLGIVVMIVKYLKTERKEMEEDLVLENFFKGIPSKKIEHEQEAVNRVAIRAFHTLTSGATWQSQQPVTVVPVVQGAYGARGDPSEEGGAETSASSEDSDCSKGDGATPGVSHSQRERSKHLPRVSLMFRDNRCSARPKMQDNIQWKNGRPFVQDRAPMSGQRLSQGSSSSDVKENGQLVAYNERSGHSNGSVMARTDKYTVTSENAQQTVRQKGGKGDTRRGAGVGVRFVDDPRRPAGRRSSAGRSRVRARNSCSSPAVARDKGSERPAANDACTGDVIVIVNKVCQDSEDDQQPLDERAADLADSSDGRSDKPRVTVTGDEGSAHHSTAATPEENEDSDGLPPKRLLVSDV